MYSSGDTLVNSLSFNNAAKRPGQWGNLRCLIWDVDVNPNSGGTFDRVEFKDFFGAHQVSFLVRLSFQAMSAAAVRASSPSRSRRYVVTVEVSK
jgi:hypothetical protein